MNITNRNSEKVADVLTKSVANYEGVYLYIDYTPGAEVQVIIKPAVKQGGNPIDKFFALMADGDKFEIALVPGQCVYPIPVPQLAETLQLTFDSLGDASAAVIDIFIDYDSEG